MLGGILSMPESGVFNQGRGSRRGPLGVGERILLDDLKEAGMRGNLPHGQTLVQGNRRRSGRPSGTFGEISRRNAFRAEGDRGRRR